MPIRSLTLASALAVTLCAAAPAWAAGGTLWNTAFNNGILEYSTGVWDSPNGGAMSLSCKDGGVTIMTQIKGKAPPPGSELRLTTSSRSGPREHRFTTDATGSVAMRAANAPAFATLWADLRRDDIVTVRYADDRFEVLSLAGANRTLPAKPCGD